MDSIEDWLDETVDPGERESWDPARLGLALAREEYPDLDPNPSLLQLDQWAEKIESLARGSRDGRDRHRALVRVLWETERLRGNAQNYYDPRNSYLCDVLESRKGIPISLALIWTAIGYRLDWPVVGLSFPGHVMVGLCEEQARLERNRYLVFDPFGPLPILDQQGIDAFFQEKVGASPGSVRPGADWIMKPRDWLIRMLLNLRGIYQQARDYPRLSRTLKHLVVLRPDEPGFLVEEGFSLMGAGKPGLALKRFQQILSQNPQGDLLAEAQKGLKLARGLLALSN